MQDDLGRHADLFLPVKALHHPHFAELLCFLDPLAQIRIGELRLDLRLGCLFRHFLAPDCCIRDVTPRRHAASTSPASIGLEIGADKARARVLNGMQRRSNRAI